VLDQTVLERNGGFASVRKVVSTFYEYVLEPDELAPYFQAIDMPRLIDHQSKFIASAMGGPGSYSDAHLERVHARLGITKASFVVVIGLLTEAMQDNGMTASDVQAVMHEIIIREHLIVSDA
jgi:hemoglobin